MGGFCGAISNRDVVLDVYFGTDYHSHLGTRRGGMAAWDPALGFQREDVYKRQESNRVKITPSNPSIEGIFDGGHNKMAIGLYILQNAMEYPGGVFPKGPKTWRDFKTLWQQHRGEVETYLAALKKDPDHGALHFYVPVELLVPRNPNDLACVESFKGELLEICAARNNNVQLQVSDKANQLGYFDVLKD